MRCIIQRVSHASIHIKNKLHSAINNGVLVFLGIEEGDLEEDIVWLASKIIKLRIFNDENGNMNLSLNNVNGQIMLVSQFTLHASTKKGNRPSYIRAAKPEKAILLYEAFIKELKAISAATIVTGIFGADMQVKLLNNGPVTIFIDTKNRE
jgi:D-aminoacyl-tRNA deacylase